MAELLAATPLDSEQRHYADMLHISGQTLLSLLNDILDFSKIEAGRLELEHIVFNPVREIQSVVEMMTVRAREKQVGLRLEPATDLPPALAGDPARLRQIIMNLVGNAIKFTDAGEIIVKVEASRHAAATTMLRCEVADTGIGIAETALPGLFASFKQADSSTTRRYGGTGLGLAICKQLVEAMGGEIGVSSSLGFGSNFWFTVVLENAEPAHLPADEKACAAWTAPAILPHLPQRCTTTNNGNDAAQQAATVLLIEDNSVNQLIAAAMLNKLGFAAEIASDGMDGLRLLEEKSFDLVLMDINMPGIDGYEATRRLRAGIAGSRNQHVPVIALTANAIKGDREKCLTSGMTDYLSKPLTSEALVAKIRQYGHGQNPATLQSAAQPDSAVPADADNANVLDLQALRDEFDQDNAVVSLVLTEFQRTLAAQLKQIEDAIAAEVPEALHSAAHCLKGGAAAVMAKEVQTLAQELEALAISRQLQSAPDVFASLNAVALKLDNHLLAAIADGA